MSKVTDLSSRSHVDKCVIRRQYNRRLASLIWVALRDQKQSLFLGQQKFGDYLYDTLIRTPNNKLPKYEDGGIYEIPDGGISYKTIDNFLKRASSIFEEEESGGVSILKIENRTLAYIHVFLCIVQPDRTQKWENTQVNEGKPDLIPDADDSLHLFKVSGFLPKNLLIFSVATEHLHRAVKSAKDIALFQNENIAFGRDYCSPFAELIGALQIFQNTKSIEEDCLHIVASNWYDLRNSFYDTVKSSKPEFDYRLHMYRGKALGVMLKELVVKNSREGTFSVCPHSRAIIWSGLRAIDDRQDVMGFQYTSPDSPSFNEDSSMMEDLLLVSSLKEIDGVHTSSKNTNLYHKKDKLDVSLFLVEDTLPNIENFRELCYFVE